MRQAKFHDLLIRLDHASRTELFRSRLLPRARGHAGGNKQDLTPTSLLWRGHACGYTEEELSAAAACSVVIGNEPPEHDFGKVPVHPVGKRYQYCQPSEFERASLYD